MRKLLLALLLVLSLCGSAFGATGDITAVRISNAANGNGWIAEIDIEGLSAGGTINNYHYGMNANNTDPANAKVVFTVTGTGYDASKTNGAKVRTYYAVPDVNTGGMRKAYPDNASPDESVAAGTLTIKVPLSDFVYTGETVTITMSEGFYCDDGATCAAGHHSHATTDLAVTNNSTLTYAGIPPIGRWAWVPYEQVKDSTYVIEAVIFHRFAENGKPVAAVEFTCQDETGGVGHTWTGDATAMTRSTRDNLSATSNKVLVYQATVDLSGLDALNKITCNFKAYPWVGDATNVLDSSTNADPDERLTPFVFYNDKSSTLAGGFAIADPTGGCGGNWASGHTYVYATQAAAESAHTADCTASYSSISDATNAIKDYNDNHSGTGDANVAGGTILLVAGNHNTVRGAHATAIAATPTWLNIQPVSSICPSFPCADTTSVVFNDNSSGGTFGAHNKYHIRNVNINTADTLLMYGVATNHLWLDTVAWTTAGLGYSAGHGYVYVTGNTAASGFSIALKPYTTQTQRFRLIRGNNISITTAAREAAAYNVLGNYGLYPSLGSSKTGNANGLQTHDGGIWAFNSVTGTTTAELHFATTDVTTYPIGYAVVQNLHENPTENTYIAFGFPNDNENGDSNNIILWHNTFVGNRCNWGYNWQNSYTGVNLHTNWSIVGNLAWKINMKDDAFGFIGKQNITGISKANPAVITCNAHGFTSTNKYVYIQEITDAAYSDLNNTVYELTYINANSYSIAVDKSGAAADCTSGCGANSGHIPTHVGTWPVSYKVGNTGNAFLTDSSTSGDNWFGDTTGMYSTARGTATLSFVHDATTATGDSSKTNPNYRIHSNASAYNLIPSGKAVLPYDLEGNRRRTEADDAGCYTRGLGRIF